MSGERIGPRASGRHVMRRAGEAKRDPLALHPPYKTDFRFFQYVAVSDTVQLVVPLGAAAKSISTSDVVSVLT